RGHRGQEPHRAAPRQALARPRPGHAPARRLRRGAAVQPAPGTNSGCRRGGGRVSREARSEVGGVSFDFTPTEEQRDILASVRAMLDRVATEDYLREHDDAENYPYELYEQLVAMGLLGLPFSEEDGGLGRGILDFALVAEEIGRKGY